MRVMLVTGFYPGEKMGGAEYQTMLLAQGLARKGHKVIFLATSTGRENVADIDGVTIWEVPGWRAVGWKQHRQQVAQVLRDTEPDICYVRLLTELANMASLCKQSDIPVVSVSCSLKETTPFLFGYHLREAIGYLRSFQTIPHFQSFLAIRSSAAHVCNTHDLKRRVQHWFPRKPIHTIYNGSPLAPQEEIHCISTGQVIWVNNFKRGKRPRLYVELAQRLPQYTFIMVGAIAPRGRYAKSMRKMIENAPPNLKYQGRLPIEEVNKLIGQSDLLLYTSKAGVEGFGNSFLQAWFRSVPTISLSFELDGILEQENVGRFAATFEELVAYVENLMEDEATRMEMGERAREYAIDNYRVDRMVADYDTLFRETAHNYSGVKVYV